MSNYLFPCQAHIMLCPSHTRSLRKSLAITSVNALISMQQRGSTTPASYNITMNSNKQLTHRSNLPSKQDNRMREIRNPNSYGKSPQWGNQLLRFKPWNLIPPRSWKSNSTSNSAATIHQQPPSNCSSKRTQGTTITNYSLVHRFPAESIPKYTPT